MSDASSHPNFPLGLDIAPLVSEKDENGSFDACAQKRAIERFGIAGRIWEAAHLLSQYVELAGLPDWQFDPPCSLIHRKDDRPLTIVELGSGTGYVGLKLADHLSRLGRTDDLLVLTDLPDVCTLLGETLHDERRRWTTTSYLMDKDIIPIKVLPLPWGDTAEANHLSGLLNGEKNIVGWPRHLTHLVCSDLVYFPHLLAPLLRSLLQLTSPPFAKLGQPPEILISYKIRSLSKETSFWSVFGLWFSFYPVCARHRTMATSQETFVESERESLDRQDWDKFGLDGFIFVGHRRPESIDWIVPDGDGDLLAGVRAQGTSMPKGDDTFENLLMMQILA